nr:MAG TPA: hypothetical protein [Caudoviricetes sp.]
MLRHYLNNFICYAPLRAWPFQNFHSTTFSLDYYLRIRVYNYNFICSYSPLI